MRQGLPRGKQRDGALRQQGSQRLGEIGCLTLSSGYGQNRTPGAHRGVDGQPCDQKGAKGGWRDDVETGIMAASRGRDRFAQGRVTGDDGEKSRKAHITKWGV
ncbi:hypothetical protein Nans01_12410 [Nocardiopsis ansamitocini]|uniref:Uncharacterized protein n=1 Tax=Nocardiopsis ansamitocini TaxID=1670832 RepID=A0A9W6P463_9ACTN|nr:hypothetical protein Nans01_12410 [Nocardiopsis ansamitocini]